MTILTISLISFNIILLIKVITDIGFLTMVTRTNDGATSSSLRGIEHDLLKVGPTVVTTLDAMLKMIETLDLKVGQTHKMIETPQDHATLQLIQGLQSELRRDMTVINERLLVLEDVLKTLEVIDHNVWSIQAQLPPPASLPQAAEDNI